MHQLGAQVTGLALAPPTEPSLFRAAGLEQLIDSHIGDIRELAVVREVLQAAQPEVVLHLAAQALVRPSYADPVGTYASNVMGSVHVLDAVRTCASVRAVVMVTSDKCYENREWPWGYRENEAMGGFDPYSSSKGCAELVTAAYRQSFFGPQQPTVVASARAGNVIGGGDWALDRLVPDILRAFGQGEPVVIRSPHAVRPWQHVLEPLAGYLLLAERLCSEGHAFATAFNFGPMPDSEVPVRQIVQQLQKAWPGSVVHIADVSPVLHEAQLLRLDATLARTRLGWRPLLNLAQTLQWTAQWYQAFAADPAGARQLTLDQIAQYGALADA